MTELVISNKTSFHGPRNFLWGEKAVVAVAQAAVMAANLSQND